jgi:hypothetical protein
MRALLDPFSFLVVSLAGWMNQYQQHVIHYLIEETGFCVSKSASAAYVSAMTSAVDWQRGRRKLGEGFSMRVRTEL